MRIQKTRAKNDKGRMVIIGLDCLAPELVFKHFIESLPHFRRLIKRGQHGLLKSVTPAITVPAWACMATGMSPGQLGVYGFRGREGYAKDKIASSLSFSQQPLWSILSRAGVRCRQLAVPQTYPVKPVRGVTVGGFLVPSTEDTFSYPPHVGQLLNEQYTPWRVDVDDFRTQDKTRLLKDIYRLTGQNFSEAKEWLSKDDWDFFMMVDIGPDRLHHGFWQEDTGLGAGLGADSDVAPDVGPDVVFEYYRYLDQQLGELLSVLDKEDVVMVVSDHGAQAMQGGFALNQWLIEEGLLVLKKGAASTGALDWQEIDWQHTQVWGDGGYVGRLYFNIIGREKLGMVLPRDIGELTKRLKDSLSRRFKRQGMGAFTLSSPQELYGENKGTAPDLTLVVDAMAYRVFGSLGHRTLFPKENDQGSDGANHAQFGTCILSYGGDGDEARSEESVELSGDIPQQVTGWSLLDIAPTVLHYFNQPIPQEMSGQGL